MRTYTTMALVLLCLTLAAQAPPAPTGRVDVAPPPSDRFPAEWYAAQDSYHPQPDNGVVHTTAPVVGAPFTAITIMSTETTMPGRAPQVVTTRSVTMRDSVGRTRIEQLPMQIDGVLLGHTGGASKDIEVFDAISHCTFEWIEPGTTEAQRKASVRCLPRTITVQPDGMKEKMMRQLPETLHPFPWQTERIEPLGERTLAGLRVLGIRQTLTDTHKSPVQSRVSEIWWSPEIEEILLVKPIGDLSSLTTEMTDIHRATPDPSLFYPPAGYKIVPEFQPGK